MSARLAGFAVGSALSIASAAAHADAMDLALERLVANPESCLSRDGTGRFEPTGSANCQPDNVAFKRLVSQLGFALAPSAMHAARTTGASGFHFALEAGYTTLASDADYWHRGTRGASAPGAGRAPSSNPSPASLLQQYAVKLRKGFGFGLEVAGVIGFVPNTHLLNGGADVRFAVLEGFRRGPLGALPDLSLGGGVRKITGSELQLTTVALDVQVSKPFTIAESSVLTPWLGYQYLWIRGDSGLVDLTPGTYAFGANARDFENNVVFEPVRVRRQRILLGFHYRYEWLLAGVQVTTDLLGPADANSGASQRALQGEARQWTWGFELGAVF